MWDESDLVHKQLGAPDDTSDTFHNNHARLHTRLCDSNPGLHARNAHPDAHLRHTFRNAEAE